MGGIFSRIKNSYAHRVFLPPTPPSYDRSLRGLGFITTTSTVEEDIFDGGSDDHGERVTRKMKIAYCFIDSGSNVTILYSGGNSCDLGIMYSQMNLFASMMNVNILLWDMPGYGLTDGVPTERSVCKSIEEVYKHYRDIIYPQIKKQHKSPKLILWGTSLGTGVSCHLASYLSNTDERGGDTYHGAILECGLSSAISVVLPQPLAYASFCVDSFKNYWNILSVNRPVFIIHGEKDRTIPISASKSLAKKIQKQYLYRFWKVKNADHNDLKEVIGYEIFTSEMSKFISYCCSR